MITIELNSTTYLITSFMSGAVEGKLYRLEQRDIGRVQVAVKKNSKEAKAVYAALAGR